jgi:hypothetical protein
MTHDKALILVVDPKKSLWVDTDVITNIQEACLMG